MATLAEFGVHIAAVHHATEAYKIAGRLAQEHVCAAVWPDWWGFKREAEDGIPENAAFIDAAGSCAILHSDIPVLGSLLNIEAAKAAAAGRPRRTVHSPRASHPLDHLKSSARLDAGLQDRADRGRNETRTSSFGPAIRSACTVRRISSHRRRHCIRPPPGAHQRFRARPAAKAGQPMRPCVSHCCR